MNDKTASNLLNILQCLRWFFVVTTLLWLLIGQPFNPVRADTPITPDRIKATLKPEQCAEETVSVTAGAAPVPKLDVALVIDVTSSMKDEIDEVIRNAGQIVADIRALVPDTTFALGTLSDYARVTGDTAEEYGDSSDYPWQVDQNFTKNDTLIQTALKKISLLNGGDDAESYLRALSETESLAWRADSRRVVILFGDAPPHDPDPGRDARLGTADDLTQTDVIKQLTTANIIVLTVYSNSAFRTFYETMTADTQGQAFALERAEQIPQAVQQLIAKTVSLIHTLTLEPTASEQDWLTWEPRLHHDLAPEETRQFNVTLCAPLNTAEGEYQFDLRVAGDGATIGHIPILIKVLPRTTDLSLTQIGTPDSIISGNMLSYQLTVINHGPDPATGVVVEDALPAHVALISARMDEGSCRQIADKVVCNLDSLAQDRTATIEVKVTPLTEGLLKHTAQVTGREIDPNPANNHSGGEFAVNPAADLSLTQTHYPNPTTAGQTWNYKITAVNQGPSVATSVKLMDTLPNAITFTLKTTGQHICQAINHTITCELGHLTPGLTATVEIEALSLEGGTFTNAANLTGKELDPDPGNNHTLETARVTPVTDLSIAITDKPDPVVAGQIVTYTITLTNAGPSLATGVVLTNLLPLTREMISYHSDREKCRENNGNLICPLNDLPGQASTQIAIGIVPQAEGLLAVQVNALGNEHDPDLSKNTMTEDTIVEAPWGPWWWLIPLLLIPLLLWLAWLWRRKPSTSNRRPQIGSPPPLILQPDPLDKPRPTSEGSSIEHGRR